MTAQQYRRRCEQEREADRQRALKIIDRDPELAAEIAELNQAWALAAGLLRIAGH